jgi:hypothetical protein
LTAADPPIKISAISKTPPASDDVTALLHAWSAGDHNAREQLMPLV